MTGTDRSLLVGIILLAILLFVWGRPVAGGGNAEVRVEVAGETVAVLPLLPAPATKEVPIKLARGEAVLQFRDGGVCILPMPKDLCPRGICSHSGLISRPGSSLICAPNRLVIRIVGGSGADVDATTR